MTDLEKLARQFLSKDFSDDIKDADGIAIADDDSDIQPLVHLLETVRAQGRIEGLQEADAFVKPAIHWHDSQERHLRAAISKRIRARIQELKEQP